MFSFTCASTTRGPTAMRAVLGGVGDRVVHPLDPALEDQVDDQLHLVHALVVRDLGLVAGLDERLEPELDQLGEAAAEHRLLAEEVGLGLLGERRLEDAGAAGADPGRVGERELARLAARVLRDRDQRRRAVALLVEAADDVAGALRRDHDHVVALRRHDPAVVDGEAVREEERRARLEVRRDLVAKSAACGPSGTRIATSCAPRTASATARTVRPASSAAARDELPGEARPRPRRRSRQVERVRVALAAVAEHGDLAVQERDVPRLDHFCHVGSFQTWTDGGCSTTAGARAAQADPPGAGELAHAVGADELLEGVELLGTADDLERDRVAADVGDARAEDLAERDQLGALVGGAPTVISASSRSTDSSGRSSVTRRTLTSLCICFSICSSECSEQSTRRVSREMSARSVGPTARLWML